MQHLHVHIKECTASITCFKDLRLGCGACAVFCRMLLGAAGEAAGCWGLFLTPSPSESEVRSITSPPPPVDMLTTLAEVHFHRLGAYTTGKARVVLHYIVALASMKR